jgi:hypothetical protein
VFLWLLACSPDYPTASVTAEGGAPVTLDGALAAYVVEDPSSEGGDGAGWVIMAQDPLQCDAIRAFPLATRDQDWLLYTQMGLAIYLAFDTVDNSVTYLDWEETYWGGDASSPNGTRWMEAWAFGNGQRFALEGGWFTVQRRRVDEFSGSFAVPWYAGDVEAEHCGTWDLGSLDSGLP